MAVTSVQFKGFSEWNDLYDREILPILKAEIFVGKIGEQINVTPRDQLVQQFFAHQSSPIKLARLFG